MPSPIDVSPDVRARREKIVFDHFAGMEETVAAPGVHRG